MSTDCKEAEKEATRQKHQKENKDEKEVTSPGWRCKQNSEN